MRAKKSLGQHFLKSERALINIVLAGELSAGDSVLEIGPGHGALTERLLATGAKVIAVEKDDGLFSELGTTFNKQIEEGRLELVHGDILDYVPKLKNYKLVANIPYNLTGAILEKFLSGEKQPSTVVLLVQKEVAERIVAKKTKPLDSAQGKESILSLSVKIYGEPKYIDTVKAGSFAPAPTVDSAIIGIYNISKAFFEENGVEEAHFFKLLKAGFGSKRKKLSSNLSNVVPKEKVLKAFEELGLDPNTRAESMTTETWKSLTLKLS